VQVDDAELAAIAERWFSDWSDVAEPDPNRRGNVAAALVVLERLRSEPELHDDLRRIWHEVRRPDWRGWLALRLFVTVNEGQLSSITRSTLDQVFVAHGIHASSYLGVDGGRSSRGNFRPVRQLLQTAPHELLHDSARFGCAVREVQARIIERYVVPQLSPNPIRVSVHDFPQIGALLAEIMRQAGDRNVRGHVAHHLLGVKLARVHGADQVQGLDKPVSAHDRATDAGLSRDGDFRVGDTAFHVTVAPTDRILRRFVENRTAGLDSVLYVLDEDVDRARARLADPSLTVHGLETYIINNVGEWGRETRVGKLRALVELIDAYQEQVRRLERVHSGIEIQLDGLASA
jgi:hypothetical protein